MAGYVPLLHLGSKKNQCILHWFRNVNNQSGKTGTVLSPIKYREISVLTEYSVCCNLPISDATDVHVQNFTRFTPIRYLQEHPLYEYQLLISFMPFLIVLNSMLILLARQTPWGGRQGPRAIISTYHCYHDKNMRR